MDLTPDAEDPYRDRKPYHMFNLVSPNGSVSPLCAASPRPLNLRRELWTFEWAAVTCPRCLAKRPTPTVLDAWGNEPS